MIQLLCVAPTEQEKKRVCTWEGKEVMRQHRVVYRIVANAHLWSATKYLVRYALHVIIQIYSMGDTIYQPPGPPGLMLTGRPFRNKQGANIKPDTSETLLTRSFQRRQPLSNCRHRRSSCCGAIKRSKPVPLKMCGILYPNYGTRCTYECSRCRHKMRDFFSYNTTPCVRMEKLIIRTKMG